MKGAMKAAALLALLGLGWLGGSLYWHFKILGALRSLESGAAPGKPGSPLGYAVPDEPFQEVEDAGCRALPYLFAGLDPVKNPAYLVATATLLRDQLALCRCADGTALPAEDLVLAYDDSAAERARKCDGLRQWWTAHGDGHAGWKFWTGQCR